METGTKETSEDYVFRSGGEIGRSTSGSLNPSDKRRATSDALHESEDEGDV